MADEKTAEQLAAETKAAADAKSAASAADADAKAKADADAKAIADAKAAADGQRAYLADFVSDPQNLAAMADADIGKLHDKIKASVAKASAGQTPDWATKRIDTLTGKLRDAERQGVALKRQLEEVAAGKIPTVSDDELNQRALAIASERAFNEACNKIATEGKKAIPDFDNAIAQLHKVSPLIVQDKDGQSRSTMPRPFLEAVTELENAPRVLAELAKPENNDEAARIMSLAPAKQGIALAQFAHKLAPAKAVSKAPPPPETLVNGRAHGEPSLEDTSLPMADWVKLRNAQAKANQKRY